MHELGLRESDIELSLVRLMEYLRSSRQSHFVSLLVPLKNCTIDYSIDVLSDQPVLRIESTHRYLSSTWSVGVLSQVNIIEYYIGVW